jgi:magnesium chelatase family protein
LLDRIDIHIDVPAVRFKDLRGEASPEPESSSAIRERVMHARERQRERLAGEGIFANASMTQRLIGKYCAIDSESEHLLEPP